MISLILKKNKKFSENNISWEFFLPSFPRKYSHGKGVNISFPSLVNQTNLGILRNHDSQKW